MTERVTAEPTDPFMLGVLEDLLYDSARPNSAFPRLGQVFNVNIQVHRCPVPLVATKVPRFGDGLEPAFFSRRQTVVAPAFIMTKRRRKRRPLQPAVRCRLRWSRQPSRRRRGRQTSLARERLHQLGYPLEWSYATHRACLARSVPSLISLIGAAAMGCGGSATGSSPTCVATASSVPSPASVVSGTISGPGISADICSGDHVRLPRDGPGG